MHSANWDQTYDFTGKKVAVVGAGSSGVQIVASLHSKVESLHTWVRRPVWITAGYAQQFAGENGRNFDCEATPNPCTRRRSKVLPTLQREWDTDFLFLDSEEQKALLRERPGEYLAYRKMIERELNHRFGLILKGTPAAEEAKAFSEQDMRAKLGNDERLCSKIIPKDFAVGCRRTTPGNGYLEALASSKTTCFTENIGSITNKGFTDAAGTEYEVDAIICATGFDTSWIPRFPVVVNGANLQDTWSQEGVTSYLSVAVPDVPNYFTFCGPYGPLAHGSFFPIIEKYTDYIIKVIQKMQVEGIRSLRPRRGPADQFLQHAAAFLQRTAWTDPCSSWFKGGGDVNGTPTLYPGSRVSFLRLLRDPRFEDFDIEYDESNMFAFLGNGFSLEEVDRSDATYYLGSLDQPVNEASLTSILKGTAASVLRRES